MPDPLLIVDVQRGFLNQFTRHIPKRIAMLVELGDYDPLLFTRFLNTAGSPYRRFLDWQGLGKAPATSFAPEIAPLARKGRVFVKRGLTGMPRAMRTYFRRSRPACVVLAGLDTDMCVLKIAMDLFDLGIEPVVLTDCCASTMGATAHLSGLATLSRNIGPERLRDAGLSEGTVAAPEKA